MYILNLTRNLFVTFFIVAINSRIIPNYVFQRIYELINVVERLTFMVF